MARTARLGGGALLALALTALATPALARAQSGATAAGGRLSRWSDAATGSEEENYLRVLQIAGLVPLRPWSVRPFAPGELEALAPPDTGHPWARHVPKAVRDSGFAVRALWPVAGITYNSAAPFSVNDGVVWAGRGVTGAARGGMIARWRWFSARLEPVAFYSTNQSSGLVPNGQTGDQRFADALEPLSVDAPQAFGDGGYGRVDLGESTIRVDAFGLTAGASTASEAWGPAILDPLILGTNAGGFTHFFIGTSKPLNLWVATVHGRLLSGWLEQSSYSTVPTDSARRIMAGFAAVATVRGVPGLEMGITRFFHRSATDQSLDFSTFFLPFEGWYKENMPDKDLTNDNQLASVFARWVFPKAGLEVFGEYGRNDHSFDRRDNILEPDHNSAFTMGARHARAISGGRMVAIRLENINAQISHLDRVRGQSRFYQHNGIRQGHTSRGQLLGSPSGLGGSATTLGVDLYVPDGRWTFELARRVRQATVDEGAPRQRWDVYNVARAERVRFGGRGDLVLGLSGIAELNRNFTDDSYGVRLDMGWRFGRRAPREAAPPVQTGASGAPSPAP